MCCIECILRAEADLLINLSLRDPSNIVHPGPAPHLPPPAPNLPFSLPSSPRNELLLTFSSARATSHSLSTFASNQLLLNIFVLPRCICVTLSCSSCVPFGLCQTCLSLYYFLLHEDATDTDRAVLASASLQPSPDLIDTVPSSFRCNQLCSLPDDIPTSSSPDASFT